MKFLLKPLLILGFTACLPLTASSVLSGLTSSTLAGPPGATLTFEGTLLNTLGYDVYLNSWSVNLAGFHPADIDDTLFLASPYPLLASASTSAFQWFQVTIPLSMTPGAYDGTFTVLGGASDTDFAELDSLSFHVQVENGGSTAIPEPGTISLTLGGLILAAWGAWRRRAAPALLVVATCAVAHASGPVPAYQWHTFYGPTEPSSINKPLARGVAVDSTGNVYAVGITTKPADFAIGTVLHGVESDPYPYAGYILKLNPAGQLLWTAYYHVAPNAIAVGPDDYLYITGSGSFCNDDLAGSRLPGGANMSECGQGGYVMKMSTNGLVMWYAPHWITGQAIAVDPGTGNVYVGGDGNYLDNGKFPQSAVYHAPDTPREAPTVLALSSSGYYLWHSFMDKGEAHSLCVSSTGDIYMGGINTQPNGGAAIWKLHGPNSGHTTGTLATSHIWGGNRYVHGLAADNAGNVYATGDAYLTSPLLTPLLHTVATSPAIFVAKINAAGERVWYTMYGGQGGYGSGLVVDPRGYVMVQGHQPFNSFVGDGGAVSLHDNHYGNHDGGHFLLALDTSGAYQWHTFYGYPDYARPSAIAQDPNNYSVYLVGSNGANWLGDNDTQPLNPHGSSADAAYIQKFTLKTSPLLTWANPAAITAGTPLSAAQLNATADVAGQFTYTPSAGTILPVGNGQMLSTLFTPNNSEAYTAATKSVTIDVQAAATPARIVATPALARNASQIVVTLTISNSGGTAAENVRVTTARIGSTNGAPLPQSLGTMLAGGSSTVTVAFPATLGSAGAAAVLTVGGSYTGGSFTATSRIKLP